MNPYLQQATDQPDEFEMQIQMMRQKGIPEEQIQQYIAQSQGGGQNPQFGQMIPGPSPMQQGAAMGRDRFNDAAQAIGNQMYPNTGPVGQPSPAQYGKDLMQGAEEAAKKVKTKFNSWWDEL